MFTNYGSLSCNFCVNQAFYFSVGGSPCIGGNMEHVGKESASQTPFTVSVAVQWQRYLETWSREEVCSVFWFLRGRNISTLEIQRQVIPLHCVGVMRVWNPKIMVEKLRKLSNGHTSYNVRILIMQAIELGLHVQILPEQIL